MLKFREYLKMMVIFDFTDDPTIIIRIFWLNFPDDPTIKIWIFWLLLPTIRRSLFSIWFSILAITEPLTGTGYARQTDLKFFNPGIKY